MKDLKRRKDKRFLKDIVQYGVYALADGLTALCVGGSARAWSLVLIGILGVIVGIYTFIYPGATAVVLLYVIALWGIIRGAGDLITAYLLRKDLKNVSELVISGIVSILFGVAHRRLRNHLRSGDDCPCLAPSRACRSLLRCRHEL
jgi:hypothetical protein